MSAVHAAFGARVRAARTAKGWTGRELGRRAGLTTPSTVSRVESGNGIFLDGAVALAGALGIPLGVLASLPECRTCTDIPPPGFTCQACGAAGEAP